MTAVGERSGDEVQNMLSVFSLLSPAPAGLRAAGTDPSSWERPDRASFVQPSAKP